MKHLHFLVGGINSSSLEETTEAKWTSTGHETSERQRHREDREGDQNQRKKTLPSIAFATRQQKPPGSETC